MRYKHTRDSDHTLDLVCPDCFRERIYERDRLLEFVKEISDQHWSGAYMNLQEDANDLLKELGIELC